MIGVTLQDVFNKYERFKNRTDNRTQGFAYDAELWELKRILKKDRPQHADYIEERITMLGKSRISVKFIKQLVKQEIKLIEDKGLDLASVWKTYEENKES